MGIFDLFSGGSGPQRALKLKAKVIQKYGDPSVRQKALTQLGNMPYPEATSVLLARFTITVEPQTTDTEEKEEVFELICSKKEAAVQPVRDFLERSDQASAWALRILGKLLPESEVTDICTGLLQRIGPAYARDPQKKLVLLGHLEGKTSEAVAATVLPFLEDMLDDVKVAAAKLLGPLRYAPAREPLLRLLTDDETSNRVRTAVVAAVSASEFGVQGFREKVEGRLSDPWFVDKAGLIKKRG